MNKKKLLSVAILLSLALSGMAQALQLKLSNVTVKKAMTELKQKSGYSFVYEKNDVNTKKIISVDAASIEQAIEQILKGQDASYEIKGKNIIISKKEIANPSTQDLKKIHTKGRILDDNGEPVIGASIYEKNTKRGTVSDYDGNFELETSENATLEITYIGYKPQTIKAVSGQSITVRMTEDLNSLNEVVVVGFGTQKKVNLTGSVGIADAKDIESRPVTSATQALQGLIPGLQITTNTGMLDQDMTINIRGNGTIGEGSSGSPLILIDGMEGDINTLNPQDIENVSVLKDAAASSIYGSRAPFGVILITTKSGKEGKVSVNYNNSFRFSSAINMPKMMNSYDFVNYFNQASLNQGTGLTFSEEMMQEILDFQAAGGSNRGGVKASSNGQWGKPQYDPFTTAVANTDFYSEAYKSSVFSQEHNVSVSGGSKNMNYFMSGNYMGQDGLMRHGDDGQSRYSVNMKVNAIITSWLKFTGSTKFTRKNNWRPRGLNSSFYNYLGRCSWPNLPVYDENGYYFNNGLSGFPIMSVALSGEHETHADRHYYQGAFVFEPVKNWLTHVELNYSSTNMKTKETSLPQYNHDVNGNVLDTKGNTSLYEDYTGENYVNYNIYSEYSHSFMNAHNFKVMLGFQSEKMKQEFSSVRKYGLLINDMPYFDLTTGKDGKGNDRATEVAGNSSEWAVAGFFGRLNYDYMGRYLAELNLRYDGTSRFRRGSRWKWAPSFSLGWNVAQEKFWESLSSTVNQLKLRFSYGVLSNQNTTNLYPTYRTMIIKSVNGTWLQSGAKPNTADIGDLVSSALTWETVRSWNIGADFGLFNNRLTGSFDYYIRYTDDMVGPAPELPATLGISAPKTNNCDLRTNGWELTIGWRDRLPNGLSYSVRGSLSDAKTIITHYPGNATNSLSGYIEGREPGEIWGFETIGIAKTDAEMQAHLERVGGQDALGTKWAAGDIMYADLDGKPGITKGAETLDDHGDMKKIGNTTPHFFFGLDLNAEWKGFDIRAFFQGVMKRDYWSTNSNFIGYFFGVNGGSSIWGSRGLTVHDDYFRAEDIGLPGHIIKANIDSYYPRPIFSEGYKNQQPQTRYLQNASYIRLKNFQIGYTIPQTITNKIGINKCRLFISGENIWTGTSLSELFDPETISGGSGGNTYPLQKTWSFGLSLTL